VLCRLIQQVKIFLNILLTVFAARRRFPVRIFLFWAYPEDKMLPVPNKKSSLA